MKIKDIAKVFTGILSVAVFTFFFIFVVNDNRIQKNAQQLAVQQTNDGTQVSTDENSGIAEAANTQGNNDNGGEYNQSSTGTAAVVTQIQAVPTIAKTQKKAVKTVKKVKAVTKAAVQTQSQPVKQALTTQAVQTQPQTVQSVQQVKTTSTRAS